ncbi:MAG: hypothetical protein IT430_20710 [Phycisphaerales bacterium]|nr:hypothetical protein [Phycisphaerales bacterium]
MNNPMQAVEHAVKAVQSVPAELREEAFRFLLRFRASGQEVEPEPCNLTDSQKELMACARSEYAELRGEINKRIDLQNGALQRVLSLFGITATIGVAFFAALVRTRASGDENVLLSEQEILVLGKALWVLAWLFAVITTLLICNWVYQLWLIFRIHEYIAWLARTIEPQLPGAKSILFRYARHDLGQPWAGPYDKKRFRYLQVLVLYSFSFLSLGALVAIGFNLWSDATWFERTLGFALGAVVIVALVVVGVVHVSLHHVAEHETSLP